MSAHRWLTVAQAAELHPALSERYVRRLVEQRRIRYSKLGSKVLIDQADIDALIEAGRVEPRPVHLIQSRPPARQRPRAS